jgi:hypothetical protein
MQFINDFIWVEARDKQETLFPKRFNLVRSQKRIVHGNSRLKINLSIN